MHEYAAQLRQEDCGCDEPVLSLVEKFSDRRLTWWPEIGVGYYPVDVTAAPYGRAYFDRFARDADTDLGRSLMAARCEFVEQHFRGTLIDVGIGSGAFIDLRRRQGQRTFGYDINPAGRKWLEDRNLLIDPYAASFKAMTAWDVLEHIDDFRYLLSNCRGWLFLSLPIFRDAEHVLASKHYRKTEHYWYFTKAGLVFAMKVCGFELVTESAIETELGREDIGTFAFKRIDA